MLHLKDDQDQDDRQMICMEDLMTAVVDWACSYLLEYIQLRNTLKRHAYIIPEWQLRGLYFYAYSKVKLRIGYFLLKIVRLYLILLCLRILIFFKIDKSVLKELGYQDLCRSNSAFTCDNSLFCYSSVCWTSRTNLQLRHTL
jgi:hypothetical protein